MLETVFGVSSSIVAASFNRSKKCLLLYMYSLFEKKRTEVHCGLGVCSLDKIYVNALIACKRIETMICLVSLLHKFCLQLQSWTDLAKYILQYNVKSSQHANHTQQKLVSRWDAGKHALQTIRSSMVFPNLQN